MNQSKFSQKPIVQLNATDFTGSDFRIKHKDFQGRTGVIVFFMPRCGHCINLEPQYIEAAQVSQNVIPFGAIDGTKSGNRNIVDYFGIQGYPSIKIVNSGFVDTQSNMNGERSKDNLIDFACSAVPKNEKKNYSMCL